MRISGDPKFLHLMEELHVEITAFAPPAEAHARIAYALAEVRRFLVPVSVTKDQVLVKKEMNRMELNIMIHIIITEFTYESQNNALESNTKIFDCSGQEILSMKSKFITIFNFPSLVSLRSLQM